MPASTSPSIEEHAPEVKGITARPLAGSREQPTKGWRQVVGMFGHGELMEQVDEEGRRWREEENRRDDL